MVRLRAGECTGAVAGRVKQLARVLGHENVGRDLGGRMRDGRAGAGSGREGDARLDEREQGTPVERPDQNRAS